MGSRGQTHRPVIPVLRSTHLPRVVPVCLDPFRQALVHSVEGQPPGFTGGQSVQKELPLPAGPEDQARPPAPLLLCPVDNSPVRLPDVRILVGAEASVKIDRYRFAKVHGILQIRNRLVIYPRNTFSGFARSLLPVLAVPPVADPPPLAAGAVGAGGALAGEGLGLGYGEGFGVEVGHVISSSGLRR